MKSKTLLHVLISLVIGFIVGVSLYSVTKVTPSENTLEEFSQRSYSSSHYGRTQDGVLCDVRYSWYVNHTISEDQQLKIDLLLKRTIAKSFSYYKYEQIINIPDDFTVDFKSRLEDAVFAIEPGFVVTNVFITAKTTF
jgi:hypothetical protein